MVRRQLSVPFKIYHIMMTSWHFVETVLPSRVIRLTELEQCACVKPANRTSAAIKYSRTAFAPQAENLQRILSTTDNTLQVHQTHAPPPPVPSHANDSFNCCSSQEDLIATDSSQTDTSCLEVPCGSCHLELRPTSASRLSGGRGGRDLVTAWEVFACPLHNLAAS